MPDLQSELSKLANQWDSGTDGETTQPTKDAAMETMQLNTRNGHNRIREMFYDIKKTPGITKTQAVTNAVKAGGAEATALANVSILVRCGLVTFDGTGLTAFYTDYDPVKITALNAKSKGAYKRKQALKKQIKIVRLPAQTQEQEQEQDLGKKLRNKLMQSDAIANTYIQSLPAQVETTSFNAERFINQQLTLTQAKAVYKYLATVFNN